jgi:hypothetical protein
MPYKDKEYAKEWDRQNHIKNKKERNERTRVWRLNNKEHSKEYFTKLYQDRALEVVLRVAKKRAIQLGLEFNLELSDFLEIPAICPILGISLFRSGPRDNSPQIDRVIPAKGYVKGNVNIISGRANRIKSDATIKELEAILKYMKDHLGDNWLQMEEIK